MQTSNGKIVASASVPTAVGDVIVYTPGLRSGHY
jgi:hypothetical protein